MTTEITPILDPIPDSPAPARLQTPELPPETVVYGLHCKKVRSNSWVGLLDDYRLPVMNVMNDLELPKIPRPRFADAECERIISLPSQARTLDPVSEFESPQVCAISSSDAESTDDCSVVYNSDNEFLAPEVKMFISAPNIYWPVSSPCIQPESLSDHWDSKILARRSKEDDTELENTKIDSPIRKVKKKI